MDSDVQELIGMLKDALAALEPSESCGSASLILKDDTEVPLADIAGINLRTPSALSRKRRTSLKGRRNSCAGAGVEGLMTGTSELT
jgi:hypothetical protein